MINKAYFIATEQPLSATEQQHIWNEKYFIFSNDWIVAEKGSNKWFVVCCFLFKVLHYYITTETKLLMASLATSSQMLNSQYEEGARDVNIIWEAEIITIVWSKSYTVIICLTFLKINGSFKFVVGSLEIFVKSCFKFSVSERLTISKLLKIASTSILMSSFFSFSHSKSFTIENIADTMSSISFLEIEPLLSLSYNWNVPGCTDTVWVSKD